MSACCTQLAQNDLGNDGLSGVLRLLQTGSPARLRYLGLARNGIDAGLAMIVKQRSRPGEVSRMDLVGDIKGKDVVIVDDMIDTAGTLCKAADQLKFHGARRVFAFSSHGLFSGKASKRIMKSKGLEEVVCLDTIPLSNETKTHPKITQLSVAPLIAEAIKRVQWKQSVSTLFNVVKEKK